MKIAMPDYVRGILSELNNAGFAAYAVGGCVRDTLMGREPNDWDIATAASCEAVQRLFERTAPTGIKYGTVTVICDGGQAEVTTFRADGPYRGVRRPESVEFLRSLSGDLERRDFTMNAMAMDINGCVTDLFGGREDIEKMLIRCVGEPERRFAEDALRMLRCVRFSAQLGFSIEKDTLAAMRKCADLTKALSGERVREELEKTLVSERPEMIEKAREIGLLSYHFPCEGFENIKKIRDLPDEKAARWTALCASARLTAIPEALRPDGRAATLVRTAIGLAGIFDGTEAHALYLLSKFGKEALVCASAALFVGGDEKYSVLKKAAYGCEPVTLSVTGDDLVAAGIEPGKTIGEYLDRLLRYVCRHPEDNVKMRLLGLVKGKKL